MAYLDRQLIITKDGSHTMFIPEMNVTYHSHHGAIEESLHVFINAGLKYVLDTTKMQAIQIFEMGFGTGLNALLTLIEAEKLQQPVYYTAIELYPIEGNEIVLLNYCEQLNRTDLGPVFNLLHQCDWEKDVSVSPFFTIHKAKNSSCFRQPHFKMAETLCGLRLFFENGCPAVFLGHVHPGKEE